MTFFVISKPDSIVIQKHNRFETSYSESFAIARPESFVI